MHVSDYYPIYAAQPKIDVPHCPVCGRANVPLPVIDRFGLTLGLCQCACTFGYLNPRLTSAGYADFYEHWYRVLVSQVSRSHAPDVVEKSLQGYGRLLARTFPECVGVDLLDVGGSTGAISAGWTAIRPAAITVLDPNPAELARAAARGYATIIGTAEQLPVCAVPFDGVLCVQTVDHFCDPIVALSHMRAAVTDNGWMVIDFVKDVLQDVAGFVLHATPTQCPKLDHPCYWTRHSLELALKKAGWKPEIFAQRQGKGVFQCRTSS